MVMTLPFFPITSDFTWLSLLLKYLWEWLGNYISQFPQDSSVHLIKTHRFTDVRVPHVVMNQIFTYSKNGIAPSVPTFQPIHSKGAWRAVAREDCDNTACCALPCLVLQSFIGHEDCVHSAPGLQHHILIFTTRMCNKPGLRRSSMDYPSNQHSTAPEVP